MRDCAATQDERDLLGRCERALVAAARAARAGTRQQVRAAARGFVRRHRRNGSYLAFVLRKVLANSAFAVALLGLAPAPAHAATTVFIEKTGAANPMNGQNLSANAAVAAGDLDGDGDLDLVAGDFYGAFFYYQNTGSATAPAFVPRTGSANPLNGQDVGFHSAPVLADLDADGDLDLIVGEFYGTFRYYENTGSAAAPAFVPRTGSTNPLNGLSVGIYPRPALGDLDRDGDLDLVAGDRYGTLHYFANTGTATLPAFAERTGTANPLNGQDVGSKSSPALADLDGDGDLDLVAGESFGKFLYYENTSNATTPAFVPRTGAANPLDGAQTVGNPAPVLVDLDDDGDPDLLAADGDGMFEYYANLAGTFAPQTANPLAGMDVGDQSAPTLGDLDADGDLDLLSGAFNGFFYYFKNIGTALAPLFMEQTGTSNPMSVGFVGTRSKPVLYDISHVALDGKLDVTSGAADGTYHFYLNTGTTIAPAFQEQTGSQTNPFYNEDVGDLSAPSIGDLDGSGVKNVTGENFGTFKVSEPFGSFILTGWFTGQDVGFYSTPALGDVDGDGDLDLVSGENDGVFDYFENVGTTSAPVFLLHSDHASPVAGLDVGLNSTPALGDLDGDGDLDLVSGQNDGGFSYFKNVLIRPWPRYTGPIPVPLGGADVGFFSAPAAGDLDGDGDPDFVAGTSFGDGAIHYFQNTGNALQPQVIEISGTANPFNGLNAGSFAHLALGDVDADGDLDLVAGENYGNPLHFFKNTGTATSPAFVERTGTANPFNNVIVGRAVPAFGDVDGDGDLDVVVGEFNGTFHYFQNTGSAATPHFVELFGTANPFNGLSAVNFAAAALGDVDRDGDLDLLAGEESPGIFHYYENTGSATAPAFVERTGAANPLDGKSVGLNSSPTFVDLDGDGDLDVVSGERYGTFPTYYLPEPSAPAMLGAGGGLLGWLARWRRRRRG